MALFDNPEKKTALISLLFFLAFTVAVIFPFIIDADLMGWGFAFSSICLIAAVTAFISSLVFYWRATKLDAMLSGKALLTKWAYTPEEWKTYYEGEYKEESSEKKGLFLIVAGFALFFGFLFFLLDHDAGFFVLAMMVALTILIGIIAYVVPKLTYAHNRSILGSALIAENGVFLGGQFHLWGMPGSRFEEVLLRKGKQRILEITYSAPSGRMMQYYNVRIPIPSGKEEEAQKVAEALARQPR